MNYSAKLPRSESLKKSSDIQRVLKSGRRIKGEFITIIFTFKGKVLAERNGYIGSGRTKYAVLVNKKCGKAVRRNRIKRIIREFYRLHKSVFIDAETVIFKVDRFIEDDSKLLQELTVLGKKIILFRK